jgi:drug/metabolite transporter (DMT)-like permease
MQKSGEWQGNGSEVTRRGWILFAAMCVIWGIPYLLIKVAVRDLTPATLVFARTLTGALILVPLAAVRGQLRPLLAVWRTLVVYTVIEIAIPWVLLSSAERRLSSSLTGLLVAAVPLVGTVLARVTGGRDRVDARAVFGLLLGIAGVAALVGLDVGKADLGAVAGVGLVVVGYATGPLLISRSLADLPALGVVAASLGLCAIGYAPVAVVQRPASLPSGRVLAAVLVLGVVCTAVAFVAFFHLIAEVGPVRATVITYINPAVAVGLGVAFLGEAFNSGIALGFVLVLAGSFLATRRQQTPAAARLVAGAQADAGCVALPIAEP